MRVMFYIQFRVNFPQLLLFYYNVDAQVFRKKYVP